MISLQPSSAFAARLPARAEGSEIDGGPVDEASSTIKEPWDRPRPSKKPRVLFLNRSYWPDAEATGQLLTELCEDVSRDFDVTVIAGQPNSNPTGVSYRKTGWQSHGSVRIRRVLHTCFPKSFLPGRAVNLVTYLMSAWWAALWVSRPDIIVVETDPPLLCLIGEFLSRWHGCRFVVYLQDIYPDVAVALGKLPEGRISRWLRRLFFATYRRADQVVVLSEDMAQLLREAGVRPNRLARISNWADTEHVFPVKKNNPFRDRHNVNGHFVVMYSGNMGLSQRLETLLEAAEQLRERRDIQFLMIGEGATRQSLESYSRARRLDNVKFLDYQPKGELASSLSAADLQVVVLDPKISRLLMPSKFYGILASGTAVLAAAPRDSELSRLTIDERIGFVVSFHDSQSISEAIRWGADHRDELAEMGHRARLLAEGVYDRSHSTSRFASMLTELLPRPVRSPSPGRTR